MDTTPERLITPTFVAVTLSTFAYFMTLGALLPTLPPYIKDELGGGSVAVGFGIGTFAIAAAVLRPFAGRLGDLRGRRVLIVGGSFLVGVSVLGYTFATTLPILIALRFVTGVGEAAMWVGAATAIQDMAPESRRGEAASYFSVALYAGLAFGPLVGESLVDGHNYHPLFIAAGISALIASALGFFAPSGAPADPQPFRLLHPAALGPGGILLLGMIPFVSYSTYLSLYGRTVGIKNVAPLLLLYGGLVLLIRLVGAKLPDQLGWRRASTTALLLLGGAAVVMAVWGAAAGLWIATLGLALGMSLLFPALLSAAVSDVPPNERSQAVGTFSLAFDLANGLGPVVLGGVVAGTSYRGGFGVAALCGFAGLVLVTRMAGQKRGVSVEVEAAESA